MTMYNSVKSFAKTLVQLKPYVSKDGAGDVTYGLPVDKRCAVSGKIQVVRDLQGVEHVSNLQMIFDGEIQPDAMIVFNGHEYFIKAVGPFYDETAQCTLTVVYL